MRKFFAISSVLTIFVASLISASADNANFAGTWVLDKAKSGELPRGWQNAESVTWMVKQEGGQLVIEPQITGGQGPGGGQPVTYKLDGSETTADVNLGQATGKATRKVKWMNEGKTLELNSVTNAEFQGNPVTITTVEHWELGEGGVLKVHRKTQSPRGEQEFNFVFTKK